MKIYIVSLGCPKNRVDTEKLLACLVSKGAKIVLDPREANILIVNTCAFIKEAVEESIDVILELADEKLPHQKLVVCGCLVSRYGKELISELPEVDLFLGIEPFRQPELFYKKVKERLFLSLHGQETTQRILTESPFYAYLKISEGCSHVCSFCVIPRLRGPLRSTPKDLILEEARELLAQGVQELILVAQDVSAYGLDHGKRALPMLIKELANLADLKWLRLLYLHPRGVTDELIETVAENPKICPYFDIPIQHASPRILKAMRRFYDPENILKLIQKIRNLLPFSGIRTAIMVGFPGETDKDFEILIEFLKEAQFDHLGAFIFSPEEGTPAAKLPDQIPEDIKFERFDHLMKLQQKISHKRLLMRVGKEVEVLIEGFDEKGRPYGHTVFQAPEIDGITIIEDMIEPGRIVKVFLKEATHYDLFGKLSKEIISEKLT